MNEIIEKKLQLLTEQETNLLAQLHATQGAKQILLEIIKESEDIGRNEHSGD